MRAAHIVSGILAVCLSANVLTAQTGYAPVRADGNNVPALTRIITLEVRNTTVQDALRTIMRAADLEVVYRVDLPGLERRVTVREPSITVASALLRVLDRSGLQAMVSSTGQLVLTEREAGTTPADVITGSVREAVTGAPITHAEVTIRDGSSRALTDAAGRFRLRNVGSSAVTLVVRRLGYHELARADVVAGADVALELITAPTPLAAVIVAPGHFGMLEQGIGARRTLTREEIEAAPQLGDDIFRAVNRLPGVSSHDMSAAFGVRGGEHREVLLRLDGLELLEPFHLKDFESSLSIIDIGSVGGIDLITGGFGAEYGNRTAGVFDMKTLNVPPGRARTSLGLSLTNVRAASQGAFANDRGRWLFTARRGYLDLALRLGDGNTAISPRYYDVLGKVEYELTPDALLSAHLLHAGDKLHYDDEVDDPRIDSRYGSSYGWINLAATPRDGLNVLTVLATGQLTWQRDGARRPDPLARWVSLEVRDDRSYSFAGLRQDWSLELSDNALLKTGFDLRRATADYTYHAWKQRFTVNNGMLTASVDTTRAASEPGTTSVGAYVAQRLRLWSPLTLEIGAEYAHHDHTGDSNINPRANAALTVAGTTLRAAWGRYAQAHGLHELQITDGVDHFFPADVAEHRVLSVERGFRNGLNARIEAYQRKVRDPRPRFTNLDSSDDILPELGRGRARIDPERSRAQGLEFALRGAGTRFDWAASYTLSSMDERIAGEWHPGPRDQRHAFGFDVSYAPDRRWRMAAAWQYHSGWPTTPQTVRADSMQDGGYYFTWEFGAYHSVRVPSYHRLDLRVSRTFETKRGRVALFADIWNVYDRQNVRSIFTNVVGVQNGQPITVRAVDDLIPRIPSIGINWEF